MQACKKMTYGLSMSGVYVKEYRKIIIRRHYWPDWAKHPEHTENCKVIEFHVDIVYTCSIFLTQTANECAQSTIEIIELVETRSQNRMVGRNKKGVKSRNYLHIYLGE